MRQPDRRAVNNGLKNIFTAMTMSRVNNFNALL